MPRPAPALRLTRLESRDTPTSVVPGYPNYPYAVAASAPTPDGGAVLVGANYFGDRPVINKVDGAGRLDAGFDGDGVKFLDLEAAPAGQQVLFAALTDVAVQADGKIVLVGSGRAEGNTSVDFLIVRLNRDGSLDATFGGDGSVLVGFASPLGDGGPAGDVASAVALGPNGSIVVAGQIGTYAYPDPFPIEGDYTAVGVARLTAGGALDATFDGDGRATITNVNGAVREFALAAADVAVDAAGRVVLLGNQNRYGLPYPVFEGGPTVEPPKPFLARFTAGGQLDSAFGTAGVVRGVGPDAAPDAYSGGYAKRVATLADGRVLVLTQTNLGTLGEGGYAVPAVSRYTAAGQLDPTFGTGGRVVFDAAGNYSYDQDLAVTADGQVFVMLQTGALGDPSWNPTGTSIVRLGPNGATAGAITYVLPFGGPTEAFLGQSLSVGADGKLRVAGRIGYPGPVIARSAIGGDQAPITYYNDFSGLFAASLDWRAADAPTVDWVARLTGDMPGTDGPPLVRLTAPSVAAGQPPTVTVTNSDGSVRFTLEVFESTFTGGVAVALADVTGDGIDDIIASAGDGGGPRIRVFDGSTGVVLADFFAFDDSWRGGVSVAVGADGEIVTGAGVGGGPRVRVFRGDGVPLLDFFAFDESWRGGVTVAAGDVTRDGVSDVLVGAGPGGGPVVKVYDGRTGALLNELLAGDAADRGGVTLAVVGGVGTTMPIMTAKTAGGVRAYDPLTGYDLTPLYDPVAMGATVG